MATKAVLGISPGTRTVGLAIIRNGELVEWKVKTFKETWSMDKRKAILATIHALCGYHGIGTIALKKVDPLRSSPELDLLVAAIMRQAARNGVTVKQYSLSDLDFDLETGKKQTKKDLNGHVAEQHPELRKEYLRERNNRREYHTKMFEAVAMAELLLRERR